MQVWQGTGQVYANVNDFVVIFIIMTKFELQSLAFALSIANNHLILLLHFASLTRYWPGICKCKWFCCHFYYHDKIWASELSICIVNCKQSFNCPFKYEKSNFCSKHQISNMKVDQQVNVNSTELSNKLWLLAPSYTIQIVANLLCP